MLKTLFLLTSAWAICAISIASTEAQQQPVAHHGRVRVHFIAAEEVEWDLRGTKQWATLSTAWRGQKIHGASQSGFDHLPDGIEDHLAEDLSVNQIAAVARISSSHLKVVFRKSLDIPLHQYVIRRRVERAKGLLMRSDLSVTEIAIATGFAHQSHMARHMRRVMGAPPREIRRMLDDTPSV